MLSNPQPKLTFGALNLVGVATDIANYGYTFEALGDDTDWGNPVPVDEKVISWLQDGAIIARKNYDNREILVRVRIRATTSAGLAAGESALMLETGKPNLLTWTPPDGAGAPCVFSVVMSNLEHVFDDLNEDRLYRAYGLRIQAEPFVRSSTLVTVTKPAPTGTPTVTSVDTCSSVTNWTRTIQPTGGSAVTTAAVLSSGGTSVGATYQNISTTVSTRITLTRSALATAVGTTPYIRVDTSSFLSAATFASGTTGITFKLNGIAASVAVQSGTIYWLDASALGISTLSTLEASILVIGTSAASNVNLSVNDIARSNVLGDQPTNRQLLRTVDVAGSARTQGDLAIADATASLGSTLVYTYPVNAGIVAPPLRPWLLAGAGNTADATAVSGFNTAISSLSPIEFQVPATGIQPGGHLVVVRIKATSAGSYPITFGAFGTQGGLSVSGTSQGGQRVVALAANTWTVVSIGTANLPSVEMGTAGSLYVNITASGSVLIDDAWIFNIETGRLTWIECGTGTPGAGLPSNRVWLDSPNVQSPTPGAFIGFASDRSDSSQANSKLMAFGIHEFVPPATNVFTVTSNSVASSVTFSHYPRWHTHAVT